MQFASGKLVAPQLGQNELSPNKNRIDISKVHTVYLLAQMRPRDGVWSHARLGLLYW